MDECGSCERLSIRDSAKSLKKYGSTNKHVFKNQNCIKHVVCSTDTLQGIALKYGITMEQIRRLNRLWASDSLFLRKYLLIPVTEDNELFANKVESTTSSNHSEVNLPIDMEEDASSFLDKIDNSIANTIKEVRKVSGNSVYTSEHEQRSNRRKPAVSRMKQVVNNNTSADSTVPLQTVVMSNGKKLRSSLQRLEQQQDELFEL